MSFSKNLKRIREEKNMTLTDLAKAIGKTQKVIEFYESDEYSLEYPDRDTVEEIAKALNIKSEDLIGEKYISPDRQFLNLISEQTIKGIMKWHNLEDTIAPEDNKGNELSAYYNQEKVDVLVSIISELKNRPNTYNLDKCYISKVDDYDFLLLPDGEYLISGNIEKIIELEGNNLQDNILILDGGLYTEELKTLFHNIVNEADFKQELLMSEVMKGLKNL